MAGPASGVAGSSGSETPVVGTADGGAPVDGATVVVGVPVVAMKSGTRLLRRRVLLRRAYGGKCGRCWRLRRVGAVINRIWARGNDVNDAGRPRVSI